MFSQEDSHVQHSAALYPGHRRHRARLGASGFRGVRFDVRGDGNYRLLVPTRAVRNAADYQAAFTASPMWKTVSIEFATLKQNTQEPTAWTGRDLLQLTFEVTRKAGQIGWIELDNVRFYQ